MNRSLLSVLSGLIVVQGGYWLVSKIVIASIAAGSRSWFSENRNVFIVAMMILLPVLGGVVTTLLARSKCLLHVLALLILVLLVLVVRSLFDSGYGPSGVVISFLITLVGISVGSVGAHLVSKWKE